MPLDWCKKYSTSSMMARMQKIDFDKDMCASRVKVHSRE